MAEPAKYYTIQTLAELWGVSPKTVRRLVNSGELPHIRIGTLIRIRPDQVDEYERNKTEKQCQDQETQLVSLDSAREERLIQSISQAKESLRRSALTRKIAQVLS